MSRYIDADKMISDTKAMKRIVDSIAIEGIIKYLEENSLTDVVEIVHCKNCIYFQDRYVELPDGSKRPYKKGESSVPVSVGINVSSYCTRIDYAIVHGYRNGEPSVDETRLWTKPDYFCSYGERLTEGERK